MNGHRVYLDHNASAPLRPAARDAMLAAMERPGNASSIHAEGRAAREIVQQARRQVASLVGADSRGVVFTASATEAANLVLTPSLTLPGRATPERLLVGATEHACVLAGHRFERAEVVPVDANGAVDLVALEAAVTAARPPILALQAANNETGVLQAVQQAAAIVRAAGGITVCDAVQSAGRVPLTLESTGADVLILSSHKLGGPKGAGALIFANPDAHIAAPLVRGGGQERGLRAGTEDVSAIAGLGAACEAAAKQGIAEAEASRSLRDIFEAELAEISPDAVIFGALADRLPNTSCFAVSGVAAPTLLMALDLTGVAVSSGSACSSGKIARSHVLDAMRIDPHIAIGAIRVSFGWTSSRADVVALIVTLRDILSRLDRSDRAAQATPAPQAVRRAAVPRGAEPF